MAEDQLNMPKSDPDDCILVYLYSPEKPFSGNGATTTVTFWEYFKADMQRWESAEPVLPPSSSVAKWVFEDKDGDDQTEVEEEWDPSRVARAPHYGAPAPGFSGPVPVLGPLSLVRLGGGLNESTAVSPIHTIAAVLTNQSAPARQTKHRLGIDINGDVSWVLSTDFKKLEEGALHEWSRSWASRGTHRDTFFLPPLAQNCEPLRVFSIAPVNGYEIYSQRIMTSIVFAKEYPWPLPIEVARGVSFQIISRWNQIDGMLGFCPTTTRNSAGRETRMLPYWTYKDRVVPNVVHWLKPQGMDAMIAFGGFPTWSHRCAQRSEAIPVVQSPSVYGIADAPAGGWFLHLDRVLIAHVSSGWTRFVNVGKPILLDTGTRYSYLSDDIMRELAPLMGGPVLEGHAHTFGAVHNAHQYVVKFGFGPVEVPVSLHHFIAEYPSAVEDRASTVHSLGRKPCMIMGLAFFEGMAVEFNRSDPVRPTVKFGLGLLRTRTLQSA